MKHGLAFQTMDPPLWYRALDKLEILDLKLKLKELASDHDMDGYVRLFRESIDNRKLHT